MYGADGGRAQHNAPMQSPALPLDEIHAWARSRADADGLVRTAVPGLGLMCLEHPGPKLRVVYRPLVCLVLQGRKQLLVGRQEAVCGAGQALIVSADMPVTGQVIEASAAVPYLALAVELDMAALSEQAAQLGGTQPSDRAARTLLVQPTDAAVLDCGRRLLQLIERPEAIAFLHAGLLREMQYWLLTGPNGDALRAVASASSSASRMTPAVALLQSQFREALTVDRLADAAAMSRAAFHRHFKAVTSLTPVQYQKRLRLIEARRLLRHEAASATRAAYEVGYESVPQFTRDYSGMFGITPGRDRSGVN